MATMLQYSPEEIIDYRIAAGAPFDRVFQRRQTVRRSGMDVRAMLHQYSHSFDRSIIYRHMQNCRLVILPTFPPAVGVRAMVGKQFDDVHIVPVVPDCALERSVIQTAGVGVETVFQEQFDAVEVVDVDCCVEGVAPFAL
jgi:hypothetical protein